MSAITNKFVYEMLQRIQSDIAVVKADVAGVRSDISVTRSDLGKQIAILADGMITLRRDVREITNSVHTLAISTAGGERLADVEIKLDRIVQRLGTETRIP